jgi:hypothetical protein
LHHDRLDAACFQPVGHPLQIRRPASELLHWLRIATWGHGHVVAFIAYVNARDVAVDDLQSRLFYTQLSLQIRGVASGSTARLSDVGKLSSSGLPCHPPFVV